MDINHTQHWTDTMSADVSGVDGGLFNMKRGPSTTENITFTIFKGVFAGFGSATPLLDVTLGPADFTQSFALVMFQGAPANLLAGPPTPRC